MFSMPLCGSVFEQEGQKDGLEHIMKRKKFGMWNAVHQCEKHVSSDFSALKSECLKLKSEPHSKGVLSQESKTDTPKY